MLRQRSHCLVVVLAIAICSLVSGGFGIPAHIGITGILADKDGNPIPFYNDEGNTLTMVRLLAHVKFYASEIAPNAISEVFSTTTVYTNTGAFSVPVTLDTDLLTLDELWYSLGIDIKQDGLGASDYFPGRSQITSVPFALTAKPVTFFSTHGGYSTSNSGTGLSYLPAGTSNTMVVGAFTTPPGGVQFNRMNIFVQHVPANTKFSFGIYDSDGSLVASSGLVETSVEVSWSYLEVNDVPGKLRPSELYFTGILSTDPGFCSRNVVIPSVPLNGMIPVSNTPPHNGLINSSFPINSIIPDFRSIPLNITLSYDKEVEKPMLRTEGRQSQKPKVRWIPAQ